MASLSHHSGPHDQTCMSVEALSLVVIPIGDQQGIATVTAPASPLTDSHARYTQSLLQPLDSQLEGYSCPQPHSPQDGDCLKAVQEALLLQDCRNPALPPCLLPPSMPCLSPTLWFWGQVGGFRKAPCRAPTQCKEYGSVGLCLFLPSAVAGAAQSRCSREGSDVGSIHTAERLMCWPEELDMVWFES